jgi:hypothetical protein
LENPEEMDSFVHTYEHPKLNQEESQVPDGFSTDSYQTIKEELMPTLLKVSKKWERTLPNSFYEASITTHPKTRE